ncbi:MAG: hypothetical protein HKM03_09135 [Steroidobacteraceae bacterium]|nr:hypothetical protein [Steroidobacteraceae bacterium]
MAPAESPTVWRSLLKSLRDALLGTIGYAVVAVLGWRLLYPVLHVGTMLWIYPQLLVLGLARALLGLNMPLVVASWSGINSVPTLATLAAAIFVVDAFTRLVVSSHRNAAVVFVALFLVVHTSLALWSHRETLRLTCAQRIDLAFLHRFADPERRVADSERLAESVAVCRDFRASLPALSARRYREVLNRPALFRRSAPAETLTARLAATEPDTISLRWMLGDLDAIGEFALSRNIAARHLAALRVAADTQAERIVFTRLIAQDDLNLGQRAEAAQALNAIVPTLPPALAGYFARLATRITQGRRIARLSYF